MMMVMAATVTDVANWKLNVVFSTKIITNIVMRSVCYINRKSPVFLGHIVHRIFCSDLMRHTHTIAFLTTVATRSAAAARCIAHRSRCRGRQKSLTSGLCSALVLGEAS